MIETSAAFAAAAEASSRRFRARLLYGGAELGGHLRRVTVHLGSCGNTFAPGAVYVPYIEVTAAELSAAVEGKELLLQLGLLTGPESWEYVSLGFFTAERPAAGAHETSFTARGRIAGRFAGAFQPPAEPTVRNILAALQTQTGVEIHLRGLTAAGRITKPMQGLTCRQALGITAGVLGGFATERNDGAVVIAAYTAEVTAAYDGSRSTTPPVFGDGDVTIRGVRVTASQATTDGDGTVIPAVVYESGDPTLEAEDPYMTAELFPAYAAALTGLTYRTGTARLALGDPRLTPWDAVRVTDVSGQSYVLPCMSVTHIFDGGLQTELTAPGPGGGTEVPGATGQAVRDLRLAMLQVQRLFANYARVDMLNVDEIRDDAGKSWWNLRTGEISLGGYVMRGDAEFAVGESSSVPPSSGWSAETPAWAPGAYVWQRIVLTEADGSRHEGSPVCIQGAAGEPGEDATLLRIDSSRGTLFKNSVFGTVLTVTVQKGPLRITDITALRAEYGAAARLEWRWRKAEDADFRTVSASDSHISDDGFTFSVSPEDVDEKIVFQCNLEI